MTGFLRITYGPMYSNKSLTLLEEVDNFITFNQIHKDYNPKILIINSAQDTRKQLKQISGLSIHNKYKNYDFPSYIESLNIKNLKEIKDDTIKKYDYIAIDESQFFSNLKDFIDICLKLKKYVHCAGLISDSEKKPFGEIYLLIPYADEVIQLKAICSQCKILYKNAVFTKWIGNKKKINQTEIGAVDKYIPVCGKHF